MTVKKKKKKKKRHKQVKMGKSAWDLFQPRKCFDASCPE